MALNPQPIGPHTVIVRRTDRIAGRVRLVQPGSTPLRVLDCGRISVDARVPPIRVDPGHMETALVCAGGVGWVRVGTERFRVEPFDLVYVPRDTHFMVWSDVGRVDLVEVSAPVEERHPLQAVKYLDLLEGVDEVAHAGHHARLRVLLGRHAAAGRLSVGVITGGDVARDRWPLIPEVEGAELACLYWLGANSPSAVPIECDGTAAGGEVSAAFDGDLVAGPHQPRLDGTTSIGPVAMLWILGAEREVIGERFRLSPMPATSRGVSQ